MSRSLPSLRVAWVWLALVAIILPRAHAAPPPEGVVQVTATRDQVYLKGNASNGPLWLIERDPWDLGRIDAAPKVLARIASPAGFEVAVPRRDGDVDRIYRGFQAVRPGPASGDPSQPVGPRHHVDVWRGVSASQEPFPTPPSKKGLQVQMVDDALALGVKHAALNLNLAQLVDVHAKAGNPPWQSGGRTFHFEAGYLAGMDSQVKRLSDAGVVVSLILLAYESGDPELNRVVLHPAYDQTCPNHLGAFNTVTREGVEQYIAAFEFLADHYCRSNAPSGRVANFIIGNEVNSHWFWSNRGHCTMEEFAEDYLRAMRLATTAVRKASSSARVYVSLEHHWNIRYPGGREGEAFAGHPFLDYLHRRAVEEGDFDWHVAFHPYPEDLFKCRTWLDKSATRESDTPRITFKNIDLLTRYLAQPSMQYDPPPNESYSRRTRRVILSEQGFHCAAGAEGETWQAAAYAYAYRKVADNPGIDAFILHRHVDHAHEGGLNLGLWTRKANSVADPDRPRRMYEVFRQADGPRWEEAFQFALPVIGIPGWDALKP